MERAICFETSYYGPTNTRGSRIRVKNFQDRKFFSWDDSCDVRLNHSLAVQAFVMNTPNANRRQLSVTCAETDKGREPKGYSFHIIFGGED